MYYYAIKKKNLNGIHMITSTTITMINDTISYHQNTSISNYTITISIIYLISIVRSYVLLQWRRISKNTSTSNNHMNNTFLSPVTMHPPPQLTQNYICINNTNTSLSTSTITTSINIPKIINNASTTTTTNHIQLNMRQ